MSTKTKSPQAHSLSSTEQTGQQTIESAPLSAGVSRRRFLGSVASVALLSAVDRHKALADVAGGVTVNLAKVATPTASHISGDTKLSALNDGFDPANSRDDSHGSYGNWPRTDAQWIQYEWSKPVTTNRIDVYWWADGQGVGAQGPGDAGAGVDHDRDRGGVAGVAGDCVAALADHASTRGLADP